MEFLSGKRIRKFGYGTIAVLGLLLVILIREDKTEIEKSYATDESANLSNDVSSTSLYDAADETFGTSSHSHSKKEISLKQIMRRDSEGLEIMSHPEGHESLNLNGRFTHVSAAVMDENGDIQIQCFTGYEALEGALDGRASATVSRSSQKNGVTY